jgi:uncharacterized repeat protein (TIGR01451 family)
MKSLFPLVFLALMPGSAFAAFSDVPSSHEYALSIRYVQEKGYVIGYADGTYQPDASINRAEFVKILRGVRRARIEEYQNAHPESPRWEDGYCATVFGDASIGLPFSDVDKQVWFAPDVCFAVSQRLVDGYPDGTFRPSNRVNFPEAAKIIANVFDERPEADPQLWYRPYVDVLSARGAIPPSIPSVSSFITRGEMAYMIHRMERPPASASSSARGGTVEILSPANTSSRASSAAASSKKSSPQASDVFVTASLETYSPTVKKGDIILLLFTVRNDGPGAAENVTFSMTLSNRSDFDAARSDPRCRTNTTSIYNVVCTIGAMQPGAETELRIGAKTTQFVCPITLTYGGSVDAYTDGFRTGSDYHSVTVQLTCPEPEKPDLSPEIVFMEMNPGGEPVEIEYYVHNNGLAPAQNVYAFITIPSGLSVIPSSTTGGCSQAPGLLTCSLGTIQASSNAHIHVEFATTCINNRFTTEMRMQSGTPTKYPLNPLDVEFVVYCVEE